MQLTEDDELPHRDVQTENPYKMCEYDKITTRAMTAVTTKETLRVQMTITRCGQTTATALCVVMATKYHADEVKPINDRLETSLHVTSEEAKMLMSN